MENNEIQVLRRKLQACTNENAFLRIALARAIGDGMLILHDTLEDAPRFTLQKSGNGLRIALAQDDETDAENTFNLNS